MTSSNGNIFCVTGPLRGESTWIPSWRPVAWNFDVFSDMHSHNWLSKQSRSRWFYIPSCSLWHHCNGWNWSLWNTKTDLIFVVNIMAVDVLATEGARVSAAMILTYLSHMKHQSGYWYQLMIMTLSYDNYIKRPFQQRKCLSIHSAFHYNVVQQ